jgi:hypothetical protein
MGSTYFDYFFFKENCSYHLLSLLEAGDPSLHLIDRFPWWTIPTDTIRVVLDTPGLVKDATFRPARRTQLRHKQSLLNPSDEEWLLRILRGPATLQAPLFEAVAPERRALILETASEYLAYRQAADDARQEEQHRALQRQILLARAALRINVERPALDPPSPPERGHDTARIGAGVGVLDRTRFVQIALRPALHDLLGDEAGYVPNSHLEIGNLVLRLEGERAVRIERLDLARIISLVPTDRLIRSPSWQLAFGWQTVTDLPTAPRAVLDLTVGAGTAVESSWWRREVWYALAETEAQYGAVLDERHRAGGGASAGLLFDLTSRWRAYGVTTYRSYPLGHRSSFLARSFQQRYTLARDWDVRIEWNRRADRTETLFTINAYL